MNFIEKVIASAIENPQRIVLPEGTEERTLRAADILLSERIANIILLGKPEEILAKAQSLQLKNITVAQIIDPQNHAKKDLYTNLLYELRKSKGMTLEQAATLTENPLYLATLMIKNGDADGEVAGAQNATGDVLRPAFQVIKTKPGISVVSGAFLMFVDNKDFGEDGLLLFADCAVHPNPTAKELAEIAVATGETAKNLLGIEPRVALLSFSTLGSAKNELVDKVVEATKIAQAMAPDMLIEGELQADAAIVASIAQQKAPNSKLQGKANVLVFPNLECGNISYKLVQRLANAEAVGPILQGMAAPINDLSRGCSVDDIVKLVAITANQAIGMKKETINN